MVVKRLKEGSLKGAKLDKTGRRRNALASRRLVAERSGRNDPLPTLLFETAAIAELRSTGHEVRKLDQKHVEAIARSITSHGFCVPILISGNLVVDGQARIAAATQLGIREVPAIQCQHLDEIQIRTLRLASNRLGEKGEWDLDQLKVEFEELIEFGADLDDTGFSLEEADIILADPIDPETPGEDDLPEPPAIPTTKVGDIWSLGKHRIICGDALNEGAFGALMGDEKADAVFTDPPYNVRIKGNVSGLGKKVHDEFVMGSGELTRDGFRDLLLRSITLQSKCLREGSVLFVFMDWRSISLLFDVGETAGLTLINLVVWYKHSGGMGAMYRSAHELIAVFCKGEAPHTNNVALGKNGRDRQNVWCAPGANRPGSSANAMLQHHATPKPVELICDAILDVTSRGETVIDSFLGSGTTLIAAEKTGRICCGIELEPRFVDVSIRRWQEYSGQRAVLIATGESFDEVTVRRASGVRDEGE